MIVTVALVAFTMQWIDVPALQADVYEQGIIAKGMVFAVIFLSFVVVTGHRRDGQPVAGDVRHRRGVRRRMGGEPRLGHGHPAGRDARSAQLDLGGRHRRVWWARPPAHVVAIPVRRLGAVALALGTFALAFTADLVIFSQESISHGSNGWFVRWPTLDLPLLSRYDFGRSRSSASCCS